jgi:hypothetical protein
MAVLNANFRESVTRVAPQSSFSARLFSARNAKAHAATRRVGHIDARVGYCCG